MSPPSRAVAGVNDFTPENFLLQRRQPADTSTENEEEQGGSGRTLEVNQGVSSALNSPIAPMSPDPTAPSYAVDLNDLNFEHDRSNYLSGFFLI
jgi:hypothetical protein